MNNSMFFRSTAASALAAALMLSVASGAARADETCNWRWDDPIGQPGVYYPDPDALVDPTVNVIEVLPDLDKPGSEALYIGGNFEYLGGVQVNGIAKWDPELEIAVPLGNGMTLTSFLWDRGVLAITALNEPGGTAIYAGGSFEVDGVPGTSNIARWDGKQWSSVGGGIEGAVTAMVPFDDGDGPALYVGGNFTKAGELLVNNVAKWDPVAREWLPLGSGLGAGGINDNVRAMAVYDDGTGPTVFAGGFFHPANPASAAQLARWDAETSDWNPVSGLQSNPAVYAIEAFDDGAGEALFVAGRITSAISQEKLVPLNHIARWDGKDWSAVGAGISSNVVVPVRSMAVAHGTADLLYVGGIFESAGGESVSSLAVWDGKQWGPPPGGGLTNVIDYAKVFALEAFDGHGGHEPRMYAGGEFIIAGGAPAIYIAGQACRTICPQPEQACSAAHDGAGCASFGCARQVAEFDPTCCIEDWHEGCAELAGQLCEAYQHDDGSTDMLFVTTVAQSSVIMINEFMVTRGVEALDEIVVRFWPEEAEGWFSNLEQSPMAVYIWRDAVGAGDPADAVLVASQEVVIGPSSEAEVSFAFDPVYVGPAGSRFFVGLQQMSAGSAKTFPIDVSQPSGRSWVVTSMSIDPADLGGTVSAFHQLDEDSSLDWNANFPIRANGFAFTPETGDLDYDGSVCVSDLLLLLGEWGQCELPTYCPADLDHSGAVGVPDLLELLSQWGACGD